MHILLKHFTKKINDEFEYSTNDVDKQSVDMFTRRYVF